MVNAQFNPLVRTGKVNVERRSGLGFHSLQLVVERIPGSHTSDAEELRPSPTGTRSISSSLFIVS